MTLLEQLEAAIAAWHVNADALSDIITGPETGEGSQVPFPDGSGGSHPTVAKVLADMQIGNVVRFVAQELTTAQKAQVRANIGVDLDTLLSTGVQSFTPEQVTQMQTNLGLLHTIRFVEQELSANQKEQARTNLGINLSTILQIGIAQSLTPAQQTQVQTNLGLLYTLRYVQQTLTAAQKAQSRANIEAHWQPDVPVHELRVWEEEEEILVVAPQNRRWYGHATHDFQLNKTFISNFYSPPGDVGGGSGENGDYPTLDVYLEVEAPDETLRSTYIGTFSHQHSGIAQRNVAIDFPIVKGSKFFIRTVGDPGFYGLDVKLYNLHE